MKEIESSEFNKQAWFRYFARTIDIGIGATIVSLIFGFIIAIISLLLGYPPNEPSGMFFNILVFFSVAIYFFIEAGIISKFGTTPAKKLFGITLTGLNGEKLNYKISLQRGFLLWFKGMGLSLPIISFITMAVSYANFTNEGKTSWDRTFDVVVTYKQISNIRLVMGITIWLIIFILNIVALIS